MRKYKLLFVICLIAIGLMSALIASIEEKSRKRSY